MFEFSFSVRHEGCWTADIVNEFPGFEAKILQSYAYAGSSLTVIGASEITEETAEAVVDWLDHHPVVETNELVKHEDTTGMITLKTDYSDQDTEPIGTVFRQHPAITLSPAEIHGGLEHSHVMLPTKEEIQLMYDDLSEYGPVEIRTISELDDNNYRKSDLTAVSRAVGGLSTRQQQVLELALEQGYYDSPKACTIDELAEIDGATMSTVAEHLRHAESKIFQAIRPLLDATERREPTKNTA